MKILLSLAAVAALASASHAELTCTLNDQDYKALAASESKLTRAAVQALDPQSQSDLCTTRDFWHKILRLGPKLTNVDDYSPQFLSPLENQRVDKTVDQILKLSLSQSGMSVMA